MSIRVRVKECREGRVILIGPNSDFCSAPRSDARKNNNNASRKSWREFDNVTIIATKHTRKQGKTGIIKNIIGKMLVRKSQRYIQKRQSFITQHTHTHTLTTTFIGYCHIISFFLFSYFLIVALDFYPTIKSWLN